MSRLLIVAADHDSERRGRSIAPAQLIILSKAVAFFGIAADLRGRVIDVRRETRGATSLVIRPGRGWRTPVPGQYIGAEFTKRVPAHGGGNWFNLNSFSGMSRWDGRPKYQTGYGYGH